MPRPDRNTPGMEAALAMVTELGQAQAAACRAAQHLPFGYGRALVEAAHMLVWAAQRETETQRLLYPRCLRTVERLRELAAGGERQRRAA